MIIKHKTKQRYMYIYVHGGAGVFDIIGKIASKVATKAPEALAKAQASNLINKLTKEAINQGQKAAIDQSGKLAKAAVNKIIGKVTSKDVQAKQQATALINNLTSQPLPHNDQNPSSLISGMGLGPIRGQGIVLD